MSFCSKVKRQIVLDAPTNGCCMRAQTYGLLLFSHMLTRKKWSYKTEASVTAHLMAELIAACCGVYVDISESTSHDGTKKIYSVSIPTAAQRETVLSSFNMNEDSMESIDAGIIESDCCREAFIKGAFLACGSMTDPDKGFHLEFSSLSKELCSELCALLNELGLKCNMSERKRSCCAYIKDGESIEAILALLGAGDAYCEVVELRLYKKAVNDTNRVYNCDNANIEKTLNAAHKQAEIIKRIIDKKGIEAIPEELRGIALLRLEHSELTLRDLGALMNPPLSRSGVNHRMQRLLELDNEPKTGD